VASNSNGHALHSPAIQLCKRTTPAIDGTRNIVHARDVIDFVS
jgi:hypothetical protein